MQTGFYMGGGGHPTFVSVQCESRGNVMDWLWGGGARPPQASPSPKAPSSQCDPSPPPHPDIVEGGQTEIISLPQKCEPY